MHHSRSPILRACVFGLAAAALIAPRDTISAQASTSRVTTEAVSVTGLRAVTGPSVAGTHASATAAQAVRVVDAPVLDGRTDDPAWASAQIIDQFLEYDPNEGKRSRFKTE